MRALWASVFSAPAASWVSHLSGIEVEIVADFSDFFP
jgi:hypothetical protein